MNRIGTTSVARPPSRRLRSLAHMDYNPAPQCGSVTCLRSVPDRGLVGYVAVGVFALALNQRYCSRP